MPPVVVTESARILSGLRIENLFLASVFNDIRTSAKNIQHIG
jgi:hypothetical protein